MVISLNKTKNKYDHITTEKKFQLDNNISASPKAGLENILTVFP